MQPNGSLYSLLSLSLSSGSSRDLSSLSSLSSPANPVWRACTCCLFSLVKVIQQENKTRFISQTRPIPALVEHEANSSEMRGEVGKSNQFEWDEKRRMRMRMREREGKSWSDFKLQFGLELILKLHCIPLAHRNDFPSSACSYSINLDRMILFN